MKRATELQELVALTSNEPPETQITFREESASDIRYTLIVGTDDNKFLRKLAQIFGCPSKSLPTPDKNRFEAFDTWHGRGKVDLRALADEFIKTHGEFFDFDTTLAELRSCLRS